MLSALAPISAADDVGFLHATIVSWQTGLQLISAPSERCRAAQSATNDLCDEDESCAVRASNGTFSSHSFTKWTHPRDGRLFVNGTGLYGGEFAFCMSPGSGLSRTPDGYEAIVCHCYESSDEESWYVTPAGSSDSFTIALGPGGLSGLCLSAACEGAVALAPCDAVNISQWWSVIERHIEHPDEHPQRQQISLPPVAGYTATAGDCGYPVCDTILDGQVVPSSDLSHIAAVCNATPGCEGFNSNGWLKRCLPPRCPQGAAGLEPDAPCNLYTKLDPPLPRPPPAPVPDVEDAWYPVEEGAERAAADPPTVVSIGVTSCVLSQAGQSVRAAVNDLVFGNWTVLALLPPSDAVGITASSRAPSGTVVLERRWRRWSLLAFGVVGSEPPRMLRKPLGALDAVRTAIYNLSALQPDYFSRAASDPDDYLGQRILNASEHREASFLSAAKFLPPLADYTVLGDVRAPVKAVATMEGKLKRSDGADEEPLRMAGAPPSCNTSDQCRLPPRDRSYCYQGQCVPGGGTVFDAAAYLGLAPPFEEMQSGLVGGHLRVASVACFNRSTSQGFEMLAIGPLAADNDTILVALRRYVPAAPPNASFTFLSISLDRRPCSDHRSAETSRSGPSVLSVSSSALSVSSSVLSVSSSAASYCDDPAHPCCEVDGTRFYVAVLQHAQAWDDALLLGGASAMQPSLPYGERRQLDMARGVLVAASTVFIGDHPNYGTGGDYWMSGPPVRAMMDSAGVADSLPLTSLALGTMARLELTRSLVAPDSPTPVPLLCSTRADRACSTALTVADTALLQWGLFDSALAKIGFYFDTFIFPNGTIDMGTRRLHTRTERRPRCRRCSFAAAAALLPPLLLLLPPLLLTNADPLEPRASVQATGRTCGLTAATARTTAPFQTASATWDACFSSSRMPSACPATRAG